MEGTPERVRFWFDRPQEVPAVGEAGGLPEAVGRLLERYDDAKGIKWKWQSLDSSSVKAPLGGERPVPTPPTGASSAPRGIS